MPTGAQACKELLNPACVRSNLVHRAEVKFKMADGLVLIGNVALFAEHNLIYEAT